MKTRRIAALLLAAFLSLSLFSACSQDSGPSGGDTSSGGTQQEGGESKDLLDQIREKGEIVVAMEGTWSPWTYHNEADELVGYDVEVAQNIAEKLGVKATFVEGDFDGLLAGLDAGRYDLVVNGVDIDEGRQEKYDFSDPYAYGSIAVIVKSDNEDIKAMEDLEGKKTANTLTSTYAAVARKYGADVTGVDDLNQTFELLLNGRIDATLNAEVSYTDYISAHPDAQIKVACLAPESTETAIPMRKGEETASLRAAVNQALAELAEDGTLSELSNKYFGEDISKPQ